MGSDGSTSHTGFLPYKNTAKNTRYKKLTGEQALNAIQSVTPTPSLTRKKNVLLRVITNNNDASTQPAILSDFNKFILLLFKVNTVLKRAVPALPDSRFC